MPSVAVLRQPDFLAFSRAFSKKCITILNHLQQGTDYPQGLLIKCRLISMRIHRVQINRMKSLGMHSADTSWVSPCTSSSFRRFRLSFPLALPSRKTIFQECSDDRDRSHIVTLHPRLASTKVSAPSPAVPSRIVGLNPGLIPTARAIGCFVVQFCANLKPFLPCTKSTNNRQTDLL